MLTEQIPYWDRAALDGKVFSHPVNETWLRRHVAASARILDYGCGYGRLLQHLLSMGYGDVHGMDASPAMVARSAAAVPGATVALVREFPLPYPDAHVDAVLLFAVLTCIPRDDDLAALMAELRRILRPGGILYVSDMPLQDDPGHRARYESASARGAPGVFTTTDGALVRHFAADDFARLFRGFETIEMEDVAVRTMNGTPVVARQMLLARS